MKQLLFVENNRKNQRWPWVQQSYVVFQYAKMLNQTWLKIKDLK